MSWIQSRLKQATDFLEHVDKKVAEVVPIVGPAENGQNGEGGVSPASSAAALYEGAP